MSGYDPYDHEPPVDEFDAAEARADELLDAERDDFADVVLPRRVGDECVSPSVIEFAERQRERRMMECWSSDDDGPVAA